jgi:hypothetical protein
MRGPVITAIVDFLYVMRSSGIDVVGLTCADPESQQNLDNALAIARAIEHSPGMPVDTDPQDMPAYVHLRRLKTANEGGERRLPPRILNPIYPEN